LGAWRGGEREHGRGSERIGTRKIGFDDLISLLKRGDGDGNHLADRRQQAGHAAACQREVEDKVTICKKPPRFRGFPETFKIELR
jgi:hypothetical protein